MKMICNKMKIVQIWACANALNCAHIQLLVHRGFWLSADPDNFVRYFRLRNVFFVSMKNLLHLLNYFVVVCTKMFPLRSREFQFVVADAKLLEIITILHVNFFYVNFFCLRTDVVLLG